MAGTGEETDDVPSGAAKRIKGAANWMKSASDALKSVGVIFVAVSAVVTFVAVLLWEARVAPWLTEQVKAELEKEAHHDWLRYRILFALNDDNDEAAAKLAEDSKGYPIVNHFTRQVSVEEMSKIFNNPEFQKLFLREVLLSVSNRDGTRVDEILAKYEGQNLLDTWLNPPSISALEGTVTKQVDALYTYKLFFTRERKIMENGSVEVDDEGKPVFETKRQLAVRFYANKDQRITIEVIPIPRAASGKRSSTARRSSI